MPVPETETETAMYGSLKKRSRQSFHWPSQIVDTFINLVSVSGDFYSFISLHAHTWTVFHLDSFRRLPQPKFLIVYHFTFQLDVSQLIIQLCLSDPLTTLLAGSNISSSARDFWWNTPWSFRISLFILVLYSFPWTEFSFFSLSTPESLLSASFDVCKGHLIVFLRVICYPLIFHEKILVDVWIDQKPSVSCKISPREKISEKINFIDVLENER